MIARIGLARHRERTCGIVRYANAGLSPTAAQVESHQFCAALIDVVLESVGNNRGRPRDDLHVLRKLGRRATQIVRTGSHNQVGSAFFQKGSLPFARAEKV